MRKLFVALAGLFGLAWLRRRTALPAGPDLVGPDPADELRAKLAESRKEGAGSGGGAGAAQLEDAVAEQPVDEADVPDVATRRSEVHDRARRAMEDLAGPASDAPDAEPGE